VDGLSIGKWCREIGVHYRTGLRYALKGVRGHRLPTYLVGGRRHVSRAAAAEWLRTLNAAPAPPQTARPGRTNRSRAAEAELDRLGF
jgi:hypothetical protein